MSVERFDHSYKQYFQNALIQTTQAHVIYGITHLVVFYVSFQCLSVHIIVIVIMLCLTLQ